ncbi:MAG: hypothetical protein WCA06_08975 [Terrimicrobiaceae bacterium]
MDFAQARRYSELGVDPRGSQIRLDKKLLERGWPVLARQTPADLDCDFNAAGRKFAIYAADPDFDLYESIIPIKLYKPKTPQL